MINKIKKNCLIVLLLVSFMVFSAEEIVEVTPIKLPARHIDFLQEFVEIDVNQDGFIDLLELSQDEKGFGLQLVKGIVGNELLLDWPLLPEWNESLTAFSVKSFPEPVLALLGNGTVDFENRQALDVYHGVDFVNHIRIDLSNNGANSTAYDAMTLIKYNSIGDFTFAVANGVNIDVYNQNFDVALSSFILPNNVIDLDSVFFTNLLEENISILDDNGQLLIVDLNDGSTLWQSNLQISEYKIGNFDDDFYQEILAYSEVTQSLYMFDALQNVPSWTLSNFAINDFVLSDLDIDGINEIFVADGGGSILNLNHLGQAVGQSYQTNGINNFIGLMHPVALSDPVILTESEMIQIDLSIGLDSYSRQQKSFEQFLSADLDQNGVDELIAIGKTVEDIKTNYLIEVITTDEQPETQYFLTEYLDFEFDRYDIPLEVGQFDEDENLEIAVVYYNGEDDFMTWANEIKIYDGLTFELEKSISLSSFDIWGTIFQIVSADGDNNGIDEIYAFYSLASATPNTDFELVRIDVGQSAITWSSELVLGIDFSGISSSRFLAGDVDQDGIEELAIHYTWKFRIFDLDSMLFQLDLTSLFTFFSFELNQFNSQFWTMSSGSLSSSARPRSMETGEAGESVSFNFINLQFLKEIANKIYFLITAEGVKVMDKSTDIFLEISRKINHNKRNFRGPQVVNSSVDNSIYYIGNSFGYWHVKRNVIDQIFYDGFENILF